jgi:hypothetical protein
MHANTVRRNQTSLIHPIVLYLFAIFAVVITLFFASILSANLVYDSLLACHFFWLAHACASLCDAVCAGVVGAAPEKSSHSLRRARSGDGLGIVVAREARCVLVSVRQLE